ncbi:hypothetical protein C8R47DRAFT_287716 [Mycena vitilis]|nr:hypothetical protein C8R47DRAFT_287716 [Mycena vitilis]
MRSLGSLIGLFLIPLAVLTASVASVRMGCPPSDAGGSALDAPQSFATKEQRVLCFYASGSRCAYRGNSRGLWTSSSRRIQVMYAQRSSCRPLRPHNFRISRLQSLPRGVRRRRLQRCPRMFRVRPGQPPSCPR